MAEHSRKDSDRVYRVTALIFNNLCNLQGDEAASVSHAGPVDFSKRDTVLCLNEQHRPRSGTDPCKGFARPSMDLPQLRNTNSADYFGGVADYVSAHSTRIITRITALTAFFCSVSNLTMVLTESTVFVDMTSEHRAPSVVLLTAYCLPCPGNPGAFRHYPHTAAGPSASCPIVARLCRYRTDWKPEPHTAESPSATTADKFLSKGNSPN